MASGNLNARRPLSVPFEKLTWRAENPVNAACSDLSGHAAAEAIGKNPGDLVKSNQHEQTLSESEMAKA